MATKRVGKILNMGSEQRGGDGTGRDAIRLARSEWRRRQILDGATELMGRVGFHVMSIQALAEAAGVSVGLIYQYFANKDEVLEAVIVDILRRYEESVPDAIVAAPEDPVAQLEAGFRAYCQVVHDRRHATVLAYRESRTLSDAGQERIKRLELTTIEPIRQVIERGIRAGVFPANVDSQLIAHDLMIFAHAWALKYWFLSSRFGLDDYIDRQLGIVMSSLVEHNLVINTRSGGGEVLRST